MRQESVFEYLLRNERGSDFRPDTLIDDIRTYLAESAQASSSPRTSQEFRKWRYRRTRRPRPSSSADARADSRRHAAAGNVQRGKFTGSWGPDEAGGPLAASSRQVDAIAPFDVLNPGAVVQLLERHFESLAWQLGRRQTAPRATNTSSYVDNLLGRIAGYRRRCDRLCESGGLSPAMVDEMVAAFCLLLHVASLPCGSAERAELVPELIAQLRHVRQSRGIAPGESGTWRICF